MIEIDDDSHSKFMQDSGRGKPHNEDGEDSEMKREHFRYPRNCLLNFASEFFTKCSTKLSEINKKSAHEKNIELFDQKCFIRLNEVASSMIKLAPYDLDTMQVFLLSTLFLMFLCNYFFLLDGNFVKYKV